MPYADYEVQYICGEVVKRRSYTKHQRYKHTQCDVCEEVFYGYRWAKHQKEFNHDGKEIGPERLKRSDALTPSNCVHGCGTVMLPGRMKRHESVLHKRCGNCEVVFVHNWPKHECEKSAGCDGVVKDALRECQLLQATRPHAWWHAKLKTLREILPGSGDIPFAELLNVRHWESTSDKTAIYCVTNDEMQRLVDRGQQLPTKAVIRGRSANHDVADFMEQKLSSLYNYVGAKLDVQDPSRSKSQATSMAVSTVIDAMRGKREICEKLPFTLLELKGIFFGSESSKPHLLSAGRFNTIPIVYDRLFNQTSDTADGARGPADLLRSMSFSLFGKKGAFTGFHTDCPAGTWVHTLSGSKLWIFLVAGASFSDFEEHGETWAPKVRVVMLEAGDTLIMTEPTPHAVFTLEDSWMHGGMFIDIENMLVLMEKLLWIANNQNVTNEPVPTELLTGWDHLRKLFYDSTLGRNKDKRLEFCKLERKLKVAISCRSTYKGKCEDYCRCRASDVTATKCNSWCASTACCKGYRR